MAIEIASYRFKEQWHQHKCPSCKQVKYEPNTVCAITAGDHVYRCLTCLSGFWRRFGDTFMDAYLNEDEFGRLKDLAPDAKSEMLDELDQFKRDMQVEQAVKNAEKKIVKPEQIVSPEEAARIKKERHDELIDTADRITEEELMHEIAELAKEEEI